jgi:hypothetical protein
MKSNFLLNIILLTVYIFAILVGNSFPVMALADEIGAVRVWRGYKIDKLSKENFRKKLFNLFIPATPMFQSSLGLKAYLPVILPDNKPEYIPDEIALVFYKSKKTYIKTFKTIAGRAYGALHSTVFNFNGEYRSKSGWPIPFIQKEKIKIGIPFYHMKKIVNWQEGKIRIVLLSSEIKGRLKKKLNFSNFMKKLPESVDGVIGLLENNWFLYFEHWKPNSITSDSHLKSITECGTLIMKRFSENIRVDSSLFDEYSGLNNSTGEVFLNINF